MSSEGIRKYQIMQVAKNVAETSGIILPGTNILTRRIVNLKYIKDKDSSDKFIGIHVELIYQKRNNKKELWPQKEVDLREISSNFGYKFSLDSTQTQKFAQALEDAYIIGCGKLISGARIVYDDILKSEDIDTKEKKLQIISQLLDSSTDGELNELLNNKIDIIPNNIAWMRLCRDRECKLSEFKEALTQDESENYWKNFLKDNNWMLGSSCEGLICESRIDMHNIPDYLTKTYGGFIDVIEIKKPNMPFWKVTKNGNLYKYREKFLIPHEELQGAMAQTSKYILQSEKNVDSQEFRSDHEGYIPLKPRGLIIYGRSNEWGTEEWEAFRLLNNELHDLQIITYDHILTECKRMLGIMQGINGNSMTDKKEEEYNDGIPF